MLRSFKKLVSLVLVLALSLTVSLPAFAEKSNTDYKDSGAKDSGILANKIQQAESCAKTLIKEMEGKSETNSTQWNNSTSIDETVPLYDFNGNVNSYLFRLKTDGLQQGFILVDLTEKSPYAEAYCSTGKHPVDYMMLKHFNHEITAENKIVHAGMFKYAFEKDNTFYDLESNNPLNATKNDLQTSYKKSSQLACSKSSISLKSYANYPISHTLPIDTLNTTSDFNDDNNCGPTACTNFVYYWKDYSPNLWTGAVYQDLKRYLNWDSSSGVQRNAYIPGLRAYGNSRNAPIKGSDDRTHASIDWNFIATNIYNGIPLILSLDLYQDVSGGHAVVCFGYSKSTSVPTLVLADGWNNSLVSYDYRNAADIVEARYTRWK